MKNINAYTKKITIIATSLVMAYFASGIAAIAQAADLLKAEPIKQSALVQEAKDDLALSFTTLTISQFSDMNIAKTIITPQDTAKQNKAVTLTKTALIAE
jgi:hypothetical protein